MVNISKKVAFSPITIELANIVELTSVVAALLAYGTSTTNADPIVRKLGLSEFHSGNIRKDARNFAEMLVKESGLDVTAVQSAVADYKATDAYKRASRIGTLTAAGTKAKELGLATEGNGRPAGTRAR